MIYTLSLLFNQNFVVQNRLTCIFGLGNQSFFFFGWKFQPDTNWYTVRACALHRFCPCWAICRCGYYWIPRATARSARHEKPEPVSLPPPSTVFTLHSSEYVFFCLCEDWMETDSKLLLLLPFKQPSKCKCNGTFSGVYLVLRAPKISDLNCLIWRSFIMYGIPIPS